MKKEIRRRGNRTDSDFRCDIHHTDAFRVHSPERWIRIQLSHIVRISLHARL